MVMTTTANNNNQMIADAGGCPRVSPQTATTPTTADPSSSSSSSWPNFVSPTSSGASTATASTSNVLNNASKRYRAGQEAAAPAAASMGASWHAGTPFPPQAVAAQPQHYQAAAAAMVIPDHHHQQQDHQQESNAKRRRDASYFPAREVPKTLISSMGSLAAGGRGAAPGTNLRANLRQQLSGSNLMEFLGNHNDNAMDVEDHHHHHERPRSMSF